VAKLAIVATQRYSINACDFDLMFRHSEHEIVEVLYHTSVARKGWFKTGGRCPGNRNGVHTNITELPHQPWKSHDDLARQLDSLKPDYICLGNGNCDSGRWIQSHVKSKFLFSEYGWLPWNECFYIDSSGTGPLSSIRESGMKDLEGAPERSEEIEYIKKKLDVGKKVDFKDYVYVPLQVDTPTSDGKPDFKFQFTKFKNNKQFLQKIREIIPKNIKVLVKRHPACKASPSMPPGMIDISEMRLNKRELYERMRAMIAINSTSVLEAMLMNRRVFTYGDDLFSWKSLTFEHVMDQNQFVALLRCEPSANARSFINRLLERQVYRHRCRDRDYVRSHYWNQAI